MWLFLLLFQVLNSLVNLSELELKVWIEEWSMIISVVVVTVSINMTCWSRNRCFVTIDCITFCKANHLVGDLNIIAMFNIILIDKVTEMETNLLVGIVRIPFGHKRQKHAIRTATAGTSDLSNNCQFIISQTNLVFIGLNNFSIFQRTQFGGWYRFNYPRRF